MTSMPQSKDIEEQIGLTNKTQPYDALKRFISLKKKTNTGSESKGGKQFSKHIDPINKLE
jgi:hypothetical protein